MIVSVRSLSANIADRQDEDSDTVLSPDYIREKWCSRLLRNAGLKSEYDQIVKGRTFDESLPILEQAVIDAYTPDVWDNEDYSQALLATSRYYDFAVCNITATPNNQAHANNQSDRNPNGDIVRYRPNEVDWRNDIDLDGIDRRGNPMTYTEADLFDSDTFVDLCVRVTGVGGSVNNKMIVKQKNGPPT